MKTTNKLAASPAAVLVLTGLLFCGQAVRAQGVVTAWGSDLDSECNVPPGIQNPVAIAAGAYHNLALQGNGTVVAWGRNWFGATNVPARATNVVAIATGTDLSLAARSDGSVIAWGSNLSGQTNVPASVSNAVAVSAGRAHAMALRQDGLVIAWGNNDVQQTNVPPNLTDVIAIAAGYNHNLALRADHTVVAWGSQNIVPAYVTNIVAIAAGWEHSLALTSDGRVLAWGDNSYGQCSVPAIVSHATAIRAGFGHSMARLSDGTIVAWGRNYFGVTNVPAGLANVADFSAGEDHEVALTRSGSPQASLEPQTVTIHTGGAGLLKADVAGTYPLSYQWYLGSSPVPDGTNSWLVLNNLQSTNAGAYAFILSNSITQASTAPMEYNVDPSPYFLTPLPVSQNSLAGSSFAVSIEPEGVQPLVLQGQLNGINLTDNGQVDGANSSTLVLDPTTLGDSGVLMMTVTNESGSYTGLLANLSVTPIMGWGGSSYGQLQVPPTITNVVTLADSGGDHNLALLANGTVAAWGDNTYNQNSVPPFANPVVAIAQGFNHSLALESDGTVVAWGDNSAGQTNVPSAAQGAIAIAAGQGFSQAVMPDGSLVQWGQLPLSGAFTNVLELSTKGGHTLALLGDGTLLENGLGVPVPQTYSNVTEICAALSDSLLLQADGTLVAWGKNLHGQTNIPPTALNVMAIAAGDDHFVALRADGRVIAWGGTNFSQTQVPASTQSFGQIAAGSVHSLALLGQPSQRSVLAGGSTTFSAAQYANRLSTFQWLFDGVKIDGATNATLTLNNLGTTNLGVYQAVVTSAIGSVTSPAMTLMVPPLMFDPFSLSYVATNGAFKMRLTGSSGLYPVVIYSTTNLVMWTPIYTNPPTTNDIYFTDTPSVAGPRRYYRALEQQ